MKFRRLSTTIVAGGLALSALTGCGGNSADDTAWFTTFCDGLKSMQTMTGDLPGMQEKMKTLAADLKALPAPSITGGQEYADGIISTFENAANPTGEMSFPDMSTFMGNQDVAEAMAKVPACQG